MEKKLLTIQETAEVLNLGKTVVYKYINRMELKSVKIGKSRRVSIDAIEHFIRSKEVE